MAFEAALRLVQHLLDADLVGGSRCRAGVLLPGTGMRHVALPAAAGSNEETSFAYSIETAGPPSNASLQVSPSSHDQEQRSSAALAWQ